MGRNITLTDKAFLILMLIVSLSAFNYMPLAEKIPLRPFFFFSFLYIFTKVNFSMGKISKQCYIGPELKFIFWSYCITILLSIIYWKQSLYEGIMSNLQMLVFVLFYFYLQKINLSEKIIIISFVVCTILWTSIEWIQQITYPAYQFCGRFDEETGYIEERMGLIRFYITGVHIAIITLLYYAGKFIQEKNKKTFNFTIWAIALLGIIGFVSRKQIYASVFVSILSILSIKGKSRWFVICIFLLLSIYGIHELFGVMAELNEQTMTELDSDDFVRNLATAYFLFDFSNSPLYYLFGTGIHGIDSETGKLYKRLEEMYHYYVVDCGIVGFMARYGIINILLFLTPIIKILKRWKQLLLWHKLYLLYYGIMLNMAFWGNSTLGYLTYIIYLYLVDRHLEARSAKVSAISQVG